VGKAPQVLQNKRFAKIDRGASLFLQTAEGAPDVGLRRRTTVGPGRLETRKESVRSKSVIAVQDLALDQLAKVLEKATALLDQMEAILPGLVTLTDEERRAGDGRLRAGEADALGCVLKVAEAYPSSFAVLADHDGGVDPATFETALLRDRLARAAAFDELATALEALASNVRDTQVVLGGRVRSVLLAAYEIAKPLAKHDDKARSMLAPIINFYGAPARRAAKTRAQKREADKKKLG
jgi:hypothetical protein